MAWSARPASASASTRQPPSSPARGVGERAVAPIRSSGALLQGRRRRFPGPAALPATARRGATRTARQCRNGRAKRWRPPPRITPALRYAISELTPEQVIERVAESGLVGRGGAAFPHRRQMARRSISAGWPAALCHLQRRRERAGHFQRPRPDGDAAAPGAGRAGAGRLCLRGRGAASSSSAANTRRTPSNACKRPSLPPKRPVASALISRAAASISISRFAAAPALISAAKRRRSSRRSRANAASRASKPPYPTTHGLFQQPTIVNNVETLAAIPGIVRHGPAWFRQWGQREKAPAPKLLCVSGHIARPGVYEINPGLTLREFLAGPCGGVEGELQAVLMGGAAGTFLKPDELDVPLTFEALWDIGSTFGSGAVFVCNDTVDLRDVLQRLAHFFQHEKLRQMLPLPARHPAPAGDSAARGAAARRRHPAARYRLDDDREFALRPGADRLLGPAERDGALAGGSLSRRENDDGILRSNCANGAWCALFGRSPCQRIRWSASWPPAQRAPSAGFSQGQRYLVIQGQSAPQGSGRLMRRGGLCGGRLRAPGSRRAPALVIPCVSEAIYRSRYREPDKLAPDGSEMDWPVPYWYMDIGCGVMALLLAAVAEGAGGRFRRAI